jgi:hypothetical protein
MITNKPGAGKAEPFRDVLRQSRHSATLTRLSLGYCGAIRESVGKMTYARICTLT